MILLLQKDCLLHTCKALAQEIILACLHFFCPHVHLSVNIINMISKKLKQVLMKFYWHIINQKKKIFRIQQMMVIVKPQLRLVQP